MTSDPCTHCGGTGAEPRPRGGKRCAYVGCRKPAAGYMRADEYVGAAALLCDEHVRPEAHPADLRHLLVRWPS